jgi:hypothetical protein
MPPRQPQDKALVVNAAKIIHRRLRRALRDRPPMTQINDVLDGILAIVNGFILRRFPGECRDSRFASMTNQCCNRSRSRPSSVVTP